MTKKVQLLAIILALSILPVTANNGNQAKASSESEHQMPLLRIDAAGMEAVDDNIAYWLDELYIGLESYYPFVNSENYNEETMLARIKLLEDDKIKLLSISYSDEFSEKLDCGTWHIIYEKDDDGELKYCSDIYFRIPAGEYRAHAECPLKDAKKYKDEITRRFDTIVLLPALKIDTSGLSAVESSETEYMGEILWVKLQAFASLMDKSKEITVIDEKNITEIINRLEGPPFEDSGFIGASNVKFTSSDEYSKQLTYPAYLVEYTMGGNEDTTYNTDLFFPTDSGYYRVSISYDPDAVEAENEKEVKSDIKRILSSVSLDTN